MDLFVPIISESTKLETEKVWYVLIQVKNHQHGTGILFRKEMLYRVNLYDTSIRNAEDYDLLIRLNKAKIKVPCSSFIQILYHGANMTQTMTKSKCSKCKEKYKIK